MNSEKVETWHGIIISPAQHVQKSREGHRKNWLHFVCKLDNLFRSITISNENSSITPLIKILITYYNSGRLFHSVCTIQSHIINFQAFLPSFAIFHAFNDFFELKTLKLKSTKKGTLKRLKVGMVSSFHPHSMCKKVESVTAKIGCTSCTNWTISFEVSGFRTKTRLLHQQFKILITYYNSGLFLHSAGAIQSQVINFQPYLIKFAIFNAFTDVF